MLSSARAHETSGDIPPDTCIHGGYDLWDSLRMLPVRFTEFDGDTARWKYQDEHIVKLGSFLLRESSRYISREMKEVKLPYVMERKGTAWLCYFCSRCQSLLRAYEIKPGSSQF